VFRAAEETETTQENIQDLFELDEGDLAFLFLTEEKNCCSDILFIFISTAYIIKFSTYLFSKRFSFKGYLLLH
jgi:hypothetical protein